MNIYDEFPLIKHTKKELFYYFDNILLASNFFIESKTDSNGFVKYDILSFENTSYTLYVKLRNLTECGRSNKKYLRRIQTTSTAEYPKISTNSFVILGSIYLYKNEPILINRNYLNYIYHKTNRSCYVNLNSIRTASDLGYYHGHDCDQDIYLCDKKSFETLIKEYLKINYSI